MGYSLWVSKESDTTERLSLSHLSKHIHKTGKDLLKNVVIFFLRHFWLLFYPVG